MDSHVVEALQEMDVDPLFIMQEAFLGYKYRKREKKLNDLDKSLPTNLIRIYYGLNTDDTHFNTLKKTFVKNYIQGESELEGVQLNSIHSKVEIQGLKIMYEYIHSDEIDYMFNIYTLKDLHKKLFSLTEFPECAGEFRTIDVYLPHSGVDLYDWSYIRTRLNELDKEVLDLVELAAIIKEQKDINLLFEYIKRCVILKCNIIQVHPFLDGNGRVTRGFINKLFEMVDLPPIYIKAADRFEYQHAMNLAINEKNYDFILNLYLYKICDSIVELDINERLKSQNIKSSNAKSLKKTIKTPLK